MISNDVECYGWKMWNFGTVFGEFLVENCSQGELNGDIFWMKKMYCPGVNYWPAPFTPTEQEVMSQLSKGNRIFRPSPHFHCAGFLISIKRHSGTMKSQRRLRLECLPVCVCCILLTSAGRISLSAHCHNSLSDFIKIPPLCTCFGTHMDAETRAWLDGSFFLLEGTL